jgi:hypothetical protein
MLVAAVFVMAAALLTTSTTVQAAKTKKVTLYVGEKPSYGFFLGSVKSVKSSNKKVVAVSKKSGYAILNAKKTGKAKVTVTGYADAGTGNPRINMFYSKGRAENVAKALTDAGIDAARITVDAKGDTVQPYSENDKNRVSICIAK